MIARAFLGLAVVELVGAALLTLLGAELRRWSLAGKAGLSFGLGLVALTSFLFVASLAGATPRAWLGLVELGVLAAAVLVLRRERLTAWRESPGADRSPSRGARVGSAVLLLFVAGTCAIVGATSLAEPLVEWDVLAIWGLKAKVLLASPVRATDYFQDVAHAYSHLDYPLLWPLAMAWTWACSGDTDLLAVKALGPALLCAHVGMCHGLLRRRLDARDALLGTAVLAAVPMLLSQCARMSADAPLALFVLGAFGCAWLWLESGHGDDLRLAGVFAAGMLLTKNEGLALQVVLLACVAAGVALAGRRRSSSALGWLVVAPLLVTGAWFWFRAAVPKVHEDYGARLQPRVFLENVERVPVVLARAPTYLVSFTDWHLFWPLVAAVLVLTARAWVRRTAAFLVASVALVLLLYAYVYVVTPWDPVELMETSACRLLLHVAPLAVLAVAEAARAAGWLRSSDEVCESATW